MIYALFNIKTCYTRTEIKIIRKPVRINTLIIRI